MNRRLLRELELRKQQGNYRELFIPPGGVDFTTNDYLGLAKNPGLAEQADHYHQTYFGKATGLSASRLLGGNAEFTEALEHDLARFFRSDTGLLFHSGYDANLGLFSAILKKNDLVITDEWVHASVRDGIRLGLAAHHKFRHNDLAGLEQKLASAAGQYEQVYIAVESIYSMTGDQAPLPEIAALARTYHAQIIVDEAHSTGIAGEAGEGISAAIQPDDIFLARVYTFGKAWGSAGAFIACNEELKNYLVNFCRPFIYSTAVAPYQQCCIRAGLEMMPALQNERVRLAELSGVFREIFRQPGIDSPVHTIAIPGNTEVRKYAQQLQDEGFFVRPVMSPTVPEGHEQIRIVLHSYNAPEDIGRLHRELENSGLWERSIL